MMSRSREVYRLKILVPGVGEALLVCGLLIAYASSPAWAATITVNSPADTTANDGSCTLREAITAANNNIQLPGAVAGACPAGSAVDDDIINFALPGSAPWTVDLTEALPDLSTNVEIVGPGADQLTVTRPDSEDTDEDFYRIFTVTGDTTEVTISGITVSNGNIVDALFSSGGGISNEDNGTLTITDSTISGNTAQDAGAIRNDGTLEVSDSTLSGNTANAEARAIQNVGALEVSDSAFSRNSAAGGSGGGILNQCTREGIICIDGTGTATVTDSTFSRNSAGSRGGAIANSSSGTATVSDSTFSRNSAGGEGGARSNQRTLEVTGSTISDNSASGGGGGILNESAITPTVTNSTISGNTAQNGGGVYTGEATVVEHSTITSNTAPDG